MAMATLPSGGTVYFNEDAEWYVVMRMGKEVIDESGPFASRGAATVEASALDTEFGCDGDEKPEYIFSFEIVERPNGLTIEGILK